MKDGYYWARWIGEDTGVIDEWDIVKVQRFIYSDGEAEKRQDVLELGSDVPEEIEDYEFGDKIENEKYK